MESYWSSKNFQMIRQMKLELKKYSEGEEGRDYVAD